MISTFKHLNYLVLNESNMKYNYYFFTIAK